MIIVFGSINVDLVVSVPHLPAAGETVLGPDYVAVGGGKGANQALAAARAGAPVVMLGCVGDDRFAEVALSELRDAGVDLSRVRTVEKPTGCAFIAVDRHGQNQIVVASGANALPDAADVRAGLLTANDLLLLQMEVPAAQSLDVARLARVAGARVMLNLAPAAALSEDALASMDWLVVNEHEAVTVAAGLGYTGEDPCTSARWLAARSGATVVVTLGRRGALAVRGSEGWQVDAMAIEPVDSTAAGDAFVGVLAASLHAGLALPEALRRASVGGALACLTVGAQPSLPWAADIERMLGEAPELRVLTHR